MAITHGFAGRRRQAERRERGGFRLDAAAIGAVADSGATAFVCGSTRSTLAIESYLLSAGQPTDSIRVERFGPTGELGGDQ